MNLYTLTKVREPFFTFMLHPVSLVKTTVDTLLELEWL